MGPQKIHLSDPEFRKNDMELSQHTALQGPWRAPESTACPEAEPKARKEAVLASQQNDRPVYLLGKKKAWAWPGPSRTGCGQSDSCLGHGDSQ